MKYIILIINLSLLIAGCSKVERSKTIIISGHFADSNPDTVWLMVEREKELVEIDTSVSVNGEFVLIAEMNNPEMFFLKASGMDGYIRVFGSPGKIDVVGFVNEPQKSNISGSKFHSQYERAVDSIDSYNARMNEAAELYNNDTILQKQISIDDLVDKIYSDQQDFTKQFIELNNYNEVGGYLANRYLLFNSGYEDVKDLADSFQVHIPNSRYTEMLIARTELLAASAVGMPAPFLKLPDVNGDSVSIADFQGKKLLIDFWASWCGPCRRANPRLVELYATVDKTSFEILGVSLDRDKNSWLKAIEDDGLLWPQISDLAGWNTVASKIYGINSIPHSILLDENGEVLMHNPTPEQVRNTIE